MAAAAEPEIETAEDDEMEYYHQILNELDPFPHGAMVATAAKYGVSRITMHRIWKKVYEQRSNGDAIDVRIQKKGKVGPKHIEYSEDFLQSTPLNLRSSLRCFTGALKINHTAVYMLLKIGRLTNHTSSTHPSLTDANKLARMKWILSHIHPATRTEPPTFISFDNIVHIDEKWFYLSPDTRKFYLLPREDDPYRCYQSKRFKIQAMFMGVTSKPIYNAQGQMIHDGKYDIFPFVEKIPAMKKSKNREADTIETKVIERITQKVIRDMIIQHVLPAIMGKWPATMSKDIFIQQDNARPHIQPEDMEFNVAGTQNGFNIQLIQQPTQSPDLNVLDLGFFRAIQALMYQTFPKNVDELIESVTFAYERFDPKLLNYTWLQLQYVIVEILKVKGGNNYKSPHHGKARLERLRLLPQNVQVEKDVIDDCVKYLNENLPTNEEEPFIKRSLTSKW